MGEAPEASAFAPATRAARTCAAVSSLIAPSASGKTSRRICAVSNSGRAQSALTSTQPVSRLAWRMPIS